MHPNPSTPKSAHRITVAKTHAADGRPSGASKRPDYEALDGVGLPYVRSALVVGELPLVQRMQALDAATESVAALTGLKAVKSIHVGAPVFLAFEGMNRARAKNHPAAQLLLTMGDDVSLDLVPAYN